MLTTLDQKLAEILNNWTIDGWPIGNFVLVIIALLLSAILCGIIGIERELKGRSAGLRTHLLVGLGSCIIMIISIYGFPALFGEKRDVARLAAQIIAGVGFLGAGAIIHHNAGTRGLTTAGTIWLVMAIGIACGSFNFIIAILGTGIIFFVLTAVRRIETMIGSKKPRVVVVAPIDEPVAEIIMKVSSELGYAVHELTSEVEDSASGKHIVCYFQVVFPNKNADVGAYVARLEKETKALNVHIVGNNHKVK